MKKTDSLQNAELPQLKDEKTRAPNDWRGKKLAQIRAIIKQADPEVVEEVKWIKPTNPLGTAVWSDYGLICTGEIYKTAVKMTFPKGASIEDPSGLFNSYREGSARRAIDFHEVDEINEEALKALIRAAVKLNKSSTH
jgi:hypothetical protein